jgi:hypothetical protein
VRFLARAEKKTGLEDWGHSSFRDGLAAALRSLAETPGLTPLGVITYENLISQALVNRLRFVRRDAPRADLIPPLIIVGLPRSGTTILHRLLALDPAHHAPRLWELLDPFSSTPAGFRRWRTRAQVAIKTVLLPDLDRKHYTRADTEEECTLLLLNSFASPLLWDMCPLDGFLDWYQESDQTQPYLEYRRQLELIQARHPGKRLVLKAPAHLGNLAELCAAVPEAMLVQTHRDPTACYFSHCSLRTTLTKLVTEAPDRRRIADQVGRVFGRDLAGNLAFHDGFPDAVAHVSQTDLKIQPGSVIRAIHDRYDLPWTADHDKRIVRFTRDNPPGRHGKHRPLEDGWGVSRSDVDNRFAGYRKRFSDEIGG